MEFEDLKRIFPLLQASQSTKQQLRRVREAFDVAEWEDYTSGTFCTHLIQYSKSDFQCEIIDGEIQMIDISIDLSKPTRDERLFIPSVTYQKNAGVHLSVLPTLNDIMARGLYRLGIEQDNMLYSQLQSYQGYYRHLDELPHLTAHEKLELRLSMPREFWPKTWLDETQA